MMKTYSSINKVLKSSLPQEYIHSCRLCHTDLSNISFIDLFNTNNEFIQSKIKYCIGVDISEGDGLPSKICKNCDASIRNFYFFKKMCIANDLKLQKFSKVHKNTLPEFNKNIVDDCRTEDFQILNVPVNTDVISLIEEKNSAVSILLEEENIHPDAPDEVILQIKKESNITELLPRGEENIHLNAPDDVILQTKIESNTKELLQQGFKEEGNAEEISSSGSVERSVEKLSYPVFRLKETLTRSYCKECNLCFSRTDRLIWHEKQVHNIQRLYCSHCSKSFLSKSLIERHMRTHTGDKPFRCAICFKTFSQKESVNRHIARLHCEKKYECEKCPKVFTSREGLKSHFFTHHTVRTNEDLYRYKCKYCTKSFCHSSGLSRHILTHTGVIFTCKVCQKGFSDGSCLRRHSLMMHPGEETHRYEMGLLQQTRTIKNLKTGSPNGKSSLAEQPLLPYG